MYNIIIKWFIVIANVINNKNPIISHSLSYYILSMLLRLFLFYIYDRNTTWWCINAHVFNMHSVHSIEVGYPGSIYTIKLAYTNKLVLDLLFLLIVLKMAKVLIKMLIKQNVNHFSKEIAHVNLLSSDSYLFFIFIIYVDVTKIWIHWCYNYMYLSNSTIVWIRIQEFEKIQCKHSVSISWSHEIYNR